MPFHPKEKRENARHVMRKEFCYIERLQHFSCQKTNAAWRLIFIITLIPFICLAQSKEIRFSYELGLSLNRAFINDQYANNSIGYGGSFYLSILRLPHSTFFLGLELNSVKMKRDYLSEGHFVNYRNLCYNFNSLSLPAIIRIYPNSNSWLFAELGISPEFRILSYMKGIENHPIPKPDMPGVYTFVDQTGKFPIAELNKFDLIPSYGLGLKWPHERIDYILLAGWRHGLINLYTNTKDIKMKYFNVSIRAIIKKYNKRGPI